MLRSVKSIILVRSKTVVGNIDVKRHFLTITDNNKCKSPSFAKEKINFLCSHVACCKLNDNELGRIVESDRKDAFAYAAADDHGRAIRRKDSCIVLWEEALPRCIETANVGESYLTAVRVTRKYKVNAVLCVYFKKFGSVREQNGKAVVFADKSAK